MERPFGEPAVEDDLHLRERLLDMLKHLLVGPVGKEPGLLGRVELKILVAVRLDYLPGDVDYVMAAVTIVRHLERPTQQLAVARGHRGAEYAHLVAPVVDIEFAVDPVAGGLEQAGEAVADRRPAA